jgi:hypothetical protein
MAHLFVREVTAVFTYRGNMTDVLAFFGDRANWPLASESFSYTLNCRAPGLRVQYCQCGCRTAAEYEELVAQTQAKLDQFMDQRLDRRHDEWASRRERDAWQKALSSAPPSPSWPSCFP